MLGVEFLTRIYCKLQLLSGVVIDADSSEKDVNPKDSGSESGEDESEEEEEGENGQEDDGDEEDHEEVDDEDKDVADHKNEKDDSSEDGTDASDVNDSDCDIEIGKRFNEKSESTNLKNSSAEKSLKTSRDDKPTELPYVFTGKYEYFHDFERLTVN